jgi:xanthine dehydrogenase accessory factor
VVSLYQKIIEVESNGQEAAVCTVVKTKGSTPRKEGAKMLVFSSGKILGTIGGGALEKQVITDAQESIKNAKPALFSHSLLNEHGMCCGGKVDIYIEPIMKRTSFLIFGGGHIGKALASFASELDFQVTLVDERDDMTQEIDANQCTVINKNYRRILNSLSFTAQTFIAVATHNHSADREIVAYCAKKPHAYLGMIGSKRKVEMAKKIFLTGNILTEKEMNGIDWPMGINIKVQTPKEIAIAILAKMIDVRSKIKAAHA